MYQPTLLVCAAALAMLLGCSAATGPLLSGDPEDGGLLTLAGSGGRLQGLLRPPRRPDVSPAGDEDGGFEGDAAPPLDAGGALEDAGADWLEDAAAEDAAASLPDAGDGPADAGAPDAQADAGCELNACGGCGLLGCPVAWEQCELGAACAPCPMGCLFRGGSDVFSCGADGRTLHCVACLCSP